MASILLLILKWIGITAACIVGLFLAVLLLLLFVPVRYQVKAQKREGGEEPFTADIRFSFLFHLIRAGWAYPGKTSFAVKVLWFTVYDPSRPPGKKRRKAVPPPDIYYPEDKESSEEDEEDEETAPEEDGGEMARPDGAEKTSPSEEGREVRPDKPLDGAGEGDGEKVRDTEFEEEIGESGEDEEEGGKGFRRRLRAWWTGIRRFFTDLVEFFHRLLGILSNIRYTMRSIYDRIRHVIGNISRYADIVRSDMFREAFGLCRERLWGIIRSVRPKKFRLSLVLGFDDPSVMGQVLAMYGMLYPFIGNNVDIQPDFERQRFAGELFFKGRIRAAVLFWAGFRIYRDRRIRRLLRLFMQREE